ncbi:hypothetical protein SELMODRAFT_411564 [Selaginella moellendorffii]|uniref:F-box associated beta-propeller type 3 domain-containing protein n=1 Tax=Selaginella moellendorffii TaxID=88036 RepID=D8RIC1_SELML|nr:hypothetical protein SELMODRAFT_411564 [Selaginella moellendorffii]
MALAARDRSTRSHWRDEFMKNITPPFKNRHVVRKDVQGQLIYAFNWIEMEVCPQGGFLIGSAGGLLCFLKGNQVLVANPVTGCFRALPDLRAKGLISSSYMGISQDFKEYTVCFVKSRSCEEKKVEIRGKVRSVYTMFTTAHVYNSRLGCWRAASTPLGWCQLENMGEMVGSATLYLLCGHYKNLNDPEYVGLFTLDLEGLRFELKQTWPWDERLHRNHGLFVSCHGRTGVLCCTQFKNSMQLWYMQGETGGDVGGENLAKGVGKANAICLNGAVLFVEEKSLSTTILNLSTTDAVAFPFQKNSALANFVEFTPSLLLP